MLGSSVKALIRGRYSDSDRFPQAPLAGFATPQEGQPSFLERSHVRRPTTKCLGDIGMRPDITSGELSGRANQSAGDQADHLEVNLLHSSE